ncbi:MAG: type II 3-dehydroquinate dehydratase [Nitrospinae bacterium]|nr:type II 3-dehydroquinate dehydratase [Nitrospinota bacterium]
MATKLLVINGPNLNLLGEREPGIYGTDSLKSIESRLLELAKEFSVNAEFFQSNNEGDLVERVHQAFRDGVNFIVINPGAYTHTSIALRDAFLGTKIPFIEIHISNVYKREEFRHKSYLSDIALGVISGLGTLGYELAFKAAITEIQKTKNL